MAENRHIGNSMNATQWAHQTIAPALSIPPDRMLAAMAAQQQSWQQPPQQQIQQQQPGLHQQFANVAIPGQSGYSVAHPPAPPMPLVHANGIAGSTTPANHVRQYDAVKQFGSLPSQSTKRSKISVTSKTNLYISGLSEIDNDETVRELVRGIVEPKSCKAMMNDGKCRGSGFIDCVSEEDAEKAMQYILESSKQSTKKLSVKYANENEKDTQNVYVRNLPKTNFTNESLQSLFNQYGQVTSVKLLESNGTCTGTGFVRFASAEQAQLAVESMNREKKVIGDCDRPVTCKLADKTDPRRKVRASPPLHGGTSGQQSTPLVNGNYHRRQTNNNGVNQHQPVPPQQQPQQPPQQQTPMPTLLASMQNMSLSQNGGQAPSYHQAYPSPGPTQQVFYHTQAAPAATPYTMYHPQAAPQAVPQAANSYTIFPYPGPQQAHYADPLQQFYQQHSAASLHTQQQL